MFIEPSADARTGAMWTYQQYAAFVDAGFTADQAMQLVRTMVAAAIGGSRNGDGA